MGYAYAYGVCVSQGSILDTIDNKHPLKKYMIMAYTELHYIGLKVTSQTENSL